MITVSTFTANIYVGRQCGRSSLYRHRSIAESVIQKYCDKVGLCVHVYDARYIYSGGWEDGFVVGLINYPRFPAEHIAIRGKAIALAELIRDCMQQFRVTVVMPEETVMLGSATEDAG